MGDRRPRTRTGGSGAPYLGWQAIALAGANRGRQQSAWHVVPELRLVLINDAHPELLSADSATREALLTWVAWHEWGHALSITSISPHDPGEGIRLLELAPAGIRERIRRGNYPRREYIHELIAETFALVMRERIQGRSGQPLWLPNEIYQLLTMIGT
jgi:hypothetical protein